MDYGDFFNFIHFIAVRRMMFIENCIELSGIQTSTAFSEHNSCCKLQLNINKTDQFLLMDITLYLIDLNRIIHVLDDFVKEFYSYDCAKAMVSDKCPCEPLNFLSLLESFTTIALNCLVKWHQDQIKSLWLNHGCPNPESTKICLICYSTNSSLVKPYKTPAWVLIN